MSYFFNPYGDDSEPTHPALAEPVTKEDWRAYLYYEPPPTPAVVSRDAYSNMTAADRRQYDRARILAHSAMSIVPTRYMQSFRNHLQITLASNVSKAHGAKTSLIVSGPPRVGKSTLVKIVAREWELLVRAQSPWKFVGDGDDCIPVVYLPLPDTVSVKALMMSFARYFNLPVSSRVTTDALEHLVVEAVRRCETKLIIVDEFHNLDIRERDGQRANNALKALADKTGVTFILVGVDILHSRLLTEGNGTSRKTQTSGRSIGFELTNNKGRTKEDRLDWSRTVLRAERSLVLLDHPAHSLAAPNMSNYLHQRTDGSICALFTGISRAAIQAVFDGTERVDYALLERTPFDILSEEQYQARQKAARQK